MSDTSATPSEPTQPYGSAPGAPGAQQPAYGSQPQYGGPPQGQYAYGGAPAAYGQPGELGKIRSTGVCILLAIVTLGIYSLVWYFKTHDEMKRHTGNGLGGGVALLLAFFVGIVMPYLTSSEVGGMYERAGKQKPVSGATGLWYFPGILIIVGPIVWFVKTNGALNSYWRSLGVQG